MKKDICQIYLDEINLMDFHLLLIIDAYKDNESIRKFKNILIDYNLKIERIFEINIFSNIPQQPSFTQSNFFFFFST